MNEATDAGWLYADALGGIEHASAAVADTLALDDTRLGTVAESLDRASESVGGFGETLNGLEAVGRRAFAGLEGALEKFARTGKFELRDPANVAIEALGDIVEARGADIGVEQRILTALKRSEDRAVLRAKGEILRDAQRGGAFSRMGRR